MTDQRPSFDPRRCTLTVPNDLAHLPLVQGFVREYAAGAGFPPRDQGRLDLLMEEAVTNVVQGAFAVGERASFDIVCERVPTGLQITVHDEGLPYDPSLTPEYDPGADLESQTGAGLGSFLIRQIADRVEFHNLGSRGKETVFIKYLETASVTGAPPAAEAPVEEPEPVPAAERVELEFGPLRPAQAIEVCRCIYDAYRYTYVNEHMYYPDRVVALNESGDMISAVASTPDGEVAGHAALVFPEKTREIADLAIVATKARFRGQSIARRLGEYLSQEALARGLAGMFIVSGSSTAASCSPTRRRPWPSRGSPGRAPPAAPSSSASSTSRRPRRPRCTPRRAIAT
jgi:anti-sigma regulatory factor (Ser/Thr protein kinase)/GNAT superfamily N-acetyltransferase